MNFQKITLILLLFAMVFFSGCEKPGHDTYNPYTIAETPIENPVVEEIEIDPTIAIEEAVVQHTNFLTKLLAQASMIINMEASLNGLIDNQAVVRTCPDHTQTGNFAGATPTPTVSLDVTFNNCSPAATFGHTYDGTISMLFNGSLGADQTVAAGNTDDFTMKITGSGLTVNNGTTTFTITSPADIEFDYAATTGGNFQYNYVLGGDVTVSDGTYTTTYLSGMSGQFELVDINSDDDTNNPFTFIEDEFKIGIDATTVHCNNGTTTMNICMETTTPISIETLTCGCPKSGVLELETTCGGNADQYNFGSDVEGVINNTCDRYVQKNGSGFTALPSCANCDNVASVGYQTVELNGKIWLAENLNIDVPDSWCYADNPTNCDIYGKLYTWESAQVACAELGDCWRVPTEAEWISMVVSYGGFGHEPGSAYDELLDGGSTGFNVLLAGFRNSSSYTQLGTYGTMWTSTASSTTKAAQINFYRPFTRILRSFDPKDWRYSCRCILD